MKDYEPIRELLSITQAMTLATMDPDNTPRATPLYFAYDECMRLIFLSDPGSDHIKNLARTARCAIGLFPEVKDWKHICGLQMKGQGQIVPEHQIMAAMECYLNRFPFVSSLTQIVLGTKLYWFRPTWVRLIDNRKSFGYHKEWHFAEIDTNNKDP